MTMEIDALHAGQPMRNSLDPCTSCSEWQAQAERVRVLREALYALRLAREQDKYPSWEKGVPEFNKAEALADAALKATQ